MELKTKVIMSTGNVFLGTVAGLAIGAIVGILYAPEKGSTTRKQIMDKGDDYVDKIKSKADKFSGSVTDKFESTRKDAEKLMEKGKAKYDKAKKSVKNAASYYKHDNADDLKHSTS